MHLSRVIRGGLPAIVGAQLTINFLFGGALLTIVCLLHAIVGARPTIDFLFDGALLTTVRVLLTIVGILPTISITYYSW